MYSVPAAVFCLSHIRLSYDEWACTVQLIVDVREAYLRKLAFLGNREHIVTANYNSFLFLSLGAT